MAVTYRLDPSTTTYPGSTTYPGLVDASPYLRAFIDLSGSPSGAPNWSALTDSDLKAFTVSRGRESELSEFDGGNATLTVDNRDRAFDPLFTTSPYYPYIRPMTRFWLQVELSGTLYDLFKGYAQSYQQDWPDGGWSDATCTINLVDEFKVLALDALPTTSPVRDSYDGVVAADQPSGYWRLNEDPAVFVQPAEIPEANPIANGGSGGFAPGANTPTSGGFTLF